MNEFIAVHMALVHMGENIVAMKIAYDKSDYIAFNRTMDRRYIVRFPLEPLLMVLVQRETLVIVHTDDDLPSLGLDIHGLRIAMASALIDAVIDGNEVYEERKIMLDGIEELQ